MSRGEANLCKIPIKTEQPEPFVVVRIPAVKRKKLESSVMIEISAFLFSDMRLFDGDFSMLLLELLDAVPNEDVDLTVGRTTFVVGNEMEFVQHGFVNADRNAFNSHILTSK